MSLDCSATDVRKLRGAIGFLLWLPIYSNHAKQHALCASVEFSSKNCKKNQNTSFGRKKTVDEFHLIRTKKDEIARYLRAVYLLM